MDSLSPDSLIQSLGLTDQAVASRLNAIRLTPEARADLRAQWPLVEAHAEAFITDLYQRIHAIPELAELLAHDARMPRLRQAQLEYLRELFVADIDRDYVLRRLRIGLTHHRLKVTPQWYFATLTHFACFHAEVLLTSASSPAIGIERVVTLLTTIMFDAGLILDAYGCEMESTAFAEATVSTASTTGLFQTMSPSHTRHTERAGARIHLDDDEAAKRANYIGLNAAVISRLHAMRTTLAPAISPMLAEFYEFVTTTPGLAGFVPPAQVDRLVRQVESYWREVFTAQFDRPYAASRMRVGVIHERIGLTPQWYLVGLSRQTADLARSLVVLATEVNDSVQALIKAVLYDVTFVIDAYMEARAESLADAGGYASQLMAGLTAAVVVVDDLGVVRYANDRFVGMCGIDPSILYKLAIADALRFPLALKLYDEVLATSGRRTEIGEWGGTIYRITALKMEQPAGMGERPLAIVFDDITDLMRLSGTIEQDAGQYRRMADAVPCMLWELDTSTGTFLTVSRQAIEVTGHRDVTLVGRPNAWKECIAEADRARFDLVCAEIPPSGFGACEYRLIRADGQEIWVRSLLTRRASGESIISSVTLDITRDRQEERSRMTAISQVVGGVAHIINNALTVILGHLEMHSLSGGGTNHLAEATSAAEGVAKTVAQLQAFSGGQLLRTRTLYLSASISEWMESLRDWIGPNIRLVTRLRTTSPIEVDPDLLMVAIKHIVTNAKLAMPHGGVVTIDVEETIESGTGQQKWVQLIIKDTGCGMSESVRRQAIEPFFTTRGLGEAIGLGLSFVQGFVSQSGGQMILTSEPGRGTHVSLRFPLSKPPSEVAIDDAQSSTAMALVVEDDQAVRNLTTALLRRLGYNVRAVATARDAIHAVSTDRFDLLLTDVVLGEGANGVDLAHHLVALQTGLRVVIMSGYAIEGQTGIGLAPNWKALRKPFTALQLATATLGHTGTTLSTQH